MIWQNTATNQVVLWVMDQALFSSAVNWSTVGAEWEFGGTGDYNADRTIDIVWRNHGTGSNLAWLMDGITFQQVLIFSQVANGDWGIAGP